MQFVLGDLNARLLSCSVFPFNFNIILESDMIFFLSTFELFSHAGLPCSAFIYQLRFTLN